MAQRIKGYCKYCGKEYTRGGMIKHLAACRARMAANGVEGKAGCYELVICDKYSSDYWLIIQMKDTATLQDLDQFIRDIWVECCGHLSSFTICGQEYESVPSAESFWGTPAKSMNYSLKKVLSEGMVISYEYDYGSSTDLSIKVLGYLDGMKQKEKIIILSRNNPPQIMCSHCGKNLAEWVDPFELYEGDAFWCDECLKEQEARADGETGEMVEDYDKLSNHILPVCNSPRMGVCGYQGSSRYPEEFEPDHRDEKIQNKNTSN